MEDCGGGDGGGVEWKDAAQHYGKQKQMDWLCRYIVLSFQQDPSTASCDLWKSVYTEKRS